MTDHTIGTREEWLAAREELLKREKEHTRLGDELAQLRRDLPWVRVEKDYRFETDDGEKSLAELFDGRSQLLVYHFMFGPSYEVGCPVNSSIADSIDGVVPHLQARDATLLLVSQAPLEKLQGYKRRMGWQHPVGLGLARRLQLRPRLLADGGAVSRSRGADRAPVADGGRLPADRREQRPLVGDRHRRVPHREPGFSTFVREGDDVYHTYSTTWRGLEFVMTYYPILDHAPKGRDEGDDDWQLWIRRHDEYGSE